MASNSIEMLNPAKHSKLRVNTKSYNCEQNHVNAASVIINELSTVVHEYPIFITKNNNTGDFQLTAILGFSNGENLYLKGDSWQATYLPIDVLRRPFQLIRPDENSTAEGHIAVDMSSTQLQDKKGEMLFDDSGKPTAYLQRIQKMFSELLNGSEQTRTLLAKADEFGLIEPVTINIDLNDKESTSLNGLYAIKQKAVTELKGSALEECHNAGILQVCHLLLSSGIHFDKLIKWKNNLEK
ncbi:SapC family protein [Colwellia echini]|uniref:SapC family protein n=1 Tax=Colwellia echini TaxID=1982103 RepID=A0ABY3N1V2_9GAMM|nr:SapC family protein [Colwellia echini]TYK67227.1 SapC family protein [Colwellia echini]